jgi:hypothetical protein
VVEALGVAEAAQELGEGERVRSAERHVELYI